MQPSVLQLSCAGLNCTETNLIDAHIIPRGFARDMMGDTSTHNIQASHDVVKPTQHGVYDRTILCGECDGKLGAFDDYAIDVSRDFPARHRKLQLYGFECFNMPGVDGDLIAKFALAVLWRGSISTRPECKNIRLGPYESRLRDVLFGERQLSDLMEFEVLIVRFRETPSFQPQFIYSFPTFDNSTGVNRWGFAAGGFRFICKLDQRPWSGVPAELLAISVVNGSDHLFGMFVDFEGTSEHRGAVLMAHAESSRRRAKQNCRPSQT